jgi:hypothetical protein
MMALMKTTFTGVVLLLVCSALVAQTPFSPELERKAAKDAAAPAAQPQPRQTR